jgi:hypothetical protein
LRELSGAPRHAAPPMAIGRTVSTNHTLGTGVGSSVPDAWVGRLPPLPHRILCAGHFVRTRPCWPYSTPGFLARLLSFLCSSPERRRSAGLGGAVAHPDAVAAADDDASASPTHIIPVELVEATTAGRVRALQKIRTGPGFGGSSEDHLGRARELVDSTF